MIAWLKKQNATTIGMIIVGLLMIVGIILRWDYIKAEAGGAFKSLFERPDTTLTSPDTTPNR